MNGLRAACGRTGTWLAGLGRSLAESLLSDPPGKAEDEAESAGGER